MPIRLLAILAVLAVMLQAGCIFSSGGSSSDPGGEPVGVPPPTSTSGSLRVVIAGLPAGADANVLITGAGIALTATGNQGFGNLAPGSYSVSARDVLTGAVVASPTQISQIITITAATIQTVTVTYTIGRAFGLTLREVIAPGALAAAPTFLAAPAGDDRLFVAERSGRIRIVRGDTLRPTPFLDLSGRVSTVGEGGLLSFAFHPAYATNRFVFVHFVDGGGNIVVERYSASAADPDVALPTATPVLSIPHPGFSNHFGGRAAFGADGMLYLSTGDGGGGGDPNRNAQNLNSLLGKLLRIDVSTAPYTVPAGNPFLQQAGRRGEIWAYGLRNPWRFSFDNATQRLYLADVGQSAREEINTVAANSAGLNYGWPITEGSICFPATASCSNTGLVAPVHEYDHTQGCSVTGGFVYDGAAVPDIAGRYFYSDYCSGWLRSFRTENGVAVERVDWQIGSIGQVVSLGRDAAGELYVLAENGRVARIVGK